MPGISGSGAGGTYWWAVSIWVVVSDGHGSRPDTIWYITNPSPYTSVAGSVGPPERRSGAR